MVFQLFTVASTGIAFLFAAIDKTKAVRGCLTADLHQGLLIVTYCSSKIKPSPDQMWHYNISSGHVCMHQFPDKCLMAHQSMGERFSAARESFGIDGGTTSKGGTFRERFLVYVGELEGPQSQQKMEQKVDLTPVDNDGALGKDAYLSAVLFKTQQRNANLHLQSTEFPIALEPNATSHALQIRGRGCKQFLDNDCGWLFGTPIFVDTDHLNCAGPANDCHMWSLIAIPGT